MMCVHLSSAALIFRHSVLNSRLIFPLRTSELCHVHLRTRTHAHVHARTHAHNHVHIRTRARVCTPEHDTLISKVVTIVWCRECCNCSVLSEDFATGLLKNGIL